MPAFDAQSLIGQPEQAAYDAIHAAKLSFSRERRKLQDGQTPCSVADIAQSSPTAKVVVTVWWPEDGDDTCVDLSGGASRNSFASGGDNGSSHRSAAGRHPRDDEKGDA